MPPIAPPSRTRPAAQVGAAPAAAAAQPRGSAITYKPLPAAAAPTMADYRQAAIKLASKLSPAEIAGAELHVTDVGQKLTGANVKFHVEDADGNKYTFKPFPPGSTNYEKDLLAATLRTQAGEAVIPVVPQKLTLPSGQQLDGYVKPHLKGDELPADPTKWSAATRAQMLADAPWAEFLGNYDLKLDQYKTFDSKKLPQKMAIDGDWDCAMSDYGAHQSLDRFKALKIGLTKTILPPAPPAQNLMYEAYTKGQLDLDFAPMYESIDRIEKLSDADVRAAMKPFLDKQYANGGQWADFKTPDDLVAAVLARRDTLRTEFKSFEASLKAERADRAKGGLPTPSDVKTWAKEKWMHLGNWFVQSPLLGVFNRFSQRKAARQMNIEMP